MDAVMAVDFLGLPSLQVSEYLGIKPRFTDTTVTGGSAFETLVEHASLAISAGLCEVAAEGRVYMMRGGHPSAALPRHTFERVRAPVVAAGAVTEAEVEEALALLADPTVSVMSHVMMAAWGRRSGR